MAHLRVVACVDYVCEGNCKQGKDGTFWKKCQKCTTYKPIPGGHPAKVDTRQKKMEKAKKKEMRNWD